MDDNHDTWQRRIEQLYSNVAELYSHVDITVVVFDRDLVEAGPSKLDPASALKQPLAALARRVLETGEPQRDVALDEIGRQRAHGFPLREHDSIRGVVCVIDDDGARRELFVRCAMAIFDGHRRNETLLLQRLHKALEEAQLANRLRDRFLAVTAHELRSPMASILLWEQVLRDPAIDAVTRTSALDGIHESAAGQALIVADLLDVSRALNGKLHLDRQVTSLMRVLTLAIENAGPHAHARNLQLVSQLDPDLGDVLGDSRRLRQIFDNLLSNAIKCTAEGQIVVVARQTAESVTISLSDTGRGIAADFLPHMFEPFRQGAVEGEAGDGLGLGLAIAKQLVQLHAGTLSASSDGIGRGATFTVTLPRAHERAQEPALARLAIDGVRVLVVDDHKPLLEALEILLRSAGAIVMTATSAASGFAVLQRGEADVVLSDIGMPTEDGYSFVRRIRAMPGVSHSVPAIALSARASEDSRQRALAAGFDRFLTKPTEVAALLANIAELVPQKA